MAGETHEKPSLLSDVPSIKCARLAQAMEEATLDRSEIGKNAVRIKRLISIGAIWPELLEEISDLLDSKDPAPHVACFFSASIFAACGPFVASSSRL